MKTNRILLLVSLLMCQISFGQTAPDKLLHVKIRVGSASRSGINVLNLINQKTAVTNSDGDFIILAKAGEERKLKVVF